eukprot:scaffold22421_cov88-Phaeocystis_antarctica.AAC.1
MMPLIDPTFAGYVIGEPLIAKSKRQILVNTNNFACGGFGPICIADESFPMLLPLSDEKSNYIMNARRHDAGSFDWDSDDSDFANMPELLDKNSSAVSSDNNSTSSRPIARKKKVVLISNASDDNESMGKLFASNLKVAVDEMAESNSYNTIFPGR